MNASHAFQKKCESRDDCKTQHIVKLKHRMTARIDAQDKLHLAPQDKMAALRAAKTLAPLTFLSTRRGHPRVWSRCRWGMSAQIADPSSISKWSTSARPRPVTMPLSYISCNIGMHADPSKGAFGGSHPLCFGQKFNAYQAFPFEHHCNDGIFHQQMKGAAAWRTIIPRQT